MTVNDSNDDNESKWQQDNTRQDKIISIEGLEIASMFKILKIFKIFKIVKYSKSSKSSKTNLQIAWLSMTPSHLVLDTC